MRICVVEGCDKPFHARGYCTMHYRRWWTGAPLDAPYRYYRRDLPDLADPTEVFWLLIARVERWQKRMDRRDNA